MKKIIASIFLVLMLTSCGMLYDGLPNYVDYDHAIVESDSLFVYEGSVRTSTQINLPATLYNPNNYEITVRCAEVDYPIQAHKDITLILRPYITEKP